MTRDQALKKAQKAALDATDLGEWDESPRTLALLSLAWSTIAEQLRHDEEKAVAMKRQEQRNNAYFDALRARGEALDRSFT